MSKNKISIIGTSQGGRVDKIERLIKSILYLKINYELIFVDQSSDSEIEDLFCKYAALLHYKLIKYKKVSLSKARNLALSSSSGNIVCFCDDDAFYDHNILEFLCLEQYVAPRVITVPVKDFSSGKYYGNRSFPSENCYFGFLQAIKYCLSVSVFIVAESNEWIKLNLMFDEKLGVGAPLGGSEETDLIFSLMKKRVPVNYLKSYHVYHDNDYADISDVSVLKNKYRSYARGYAYVCKKYMISSNFVLFFELVSIFLKSVIGVVFSSTRALYYSRLLGLFEGLQSNKNG